MLTEVVVFPVPPLWLKMARRAGAWMRALRRRGRVGGDAARGGAGAASSMSAPASVIGGGSAAAMAPSRAPPASARTCVRHASEHACAQLAAHAHDLRDELDAEALAARGARRAARRLAAHGLAVALLRAVEGEAAVALLHLVAELHVEPLPADAAALGHRRPS